MELKVRDVAKLLGVSEKTIYRWLAERKIPAYRLHDQYRFSKAEVLEWAQAQRLTVAPEALSEASPAQEVSLAQALQQGGILYRLQGNEKTAVLRELVAAMPLPPGLDREFLYQVLVAREALASTSIGDGIALPHPRTPILAAGAPPQVTLAFLQNPVDFGALDGKPVFALFAILAPSSATHLKLLAKLAFALKQEAFRSLIQSAAGRQEILAQAAEIDATLRSRQGGAA